MGNMIHDHNLLSFQGVLTQVTQTTKQTLNRLGVFTVSSFHAYICARRSVKQDKSCLEIIL